MNRTLFFAVALAALSLGSARAAAPGDLLARMVAVNPSLHSYTATLHANVALKSFPFLSASLVGTLYHKEPNQDKVVFTQGLPMMADQFDKLYAHIESPARWQQVYVVAVGTDDGTTTTFKLTPRKKGNVDHIDAKVDDATATVESMRWNYDNGGYATMDNRYGHVQNATLVTSQTGHVEEPGYTADITTSIDNYKLNPELSDSIFEQ
jgi:outer membrane lipoprotein-sorting protein